MKKLQLRLWHPIAGFLFTKILEILNNNLFIQTQIWFLIYELTDWLSGICVLLLLYIIVRNIIRAIKSRTGYQSPETSTYADEKEKELLRKQNEILVHLIQDEHREEGR